MKNFVNNNHEATITSIAKFNLFKNLFMRLCSSIFLNIFYVFPVL
jgi:hypothetical protein